jgi:hypothetical protein
MKASSAPSARAASRPSSGEGAFLPAVKMIDAPEGRRSRRGRARPRPGPRGRCAAARPAGRRSRWRCRGGPSTRAPRRLPCGSRPPCAAAAGARPSWPPGRRARRGRRGRARRGPATSDAAPGTSGSGSPIIAVSGVAGRDVAVHGARTGGPHDHVGVLAGHRGGQRRGALVGDEQRVDGELTHGLVVVVDRLDQQLVGAGGLALGEHLGGLDAEVGVLAGQRGAEGLEADALGALEGEVEGLLAHAGVGVGEQLEQQRPGPALGDLADDLVERLAAQVGVQALEREAQAAGTGAADLEAERGLEGLAAHGLAGVAEGSLEQCDRLGAALLLELLDEQVEAAAAHVLVVGAEARGRDGERHGVLEAGERGEGRVAHAGVAVAQHQAQAGRAARVTELGQGLAGVDADAGGALTR